MVYTVLAALLCAAGASLVGGMFWMLGRKPKANQWVARATPQGYFTPGKPPKWQLLRALLFIAGDDASASITAAAAVIAVGAAFAAIGLIETSGKHPTQSPFNNGLVLFGLAIVIFGAVAAITNVGILVARRMKRVRLRNDMAILTRGGNFYIEMIRAGNTPSMNDLINWNTEVKKLLHDHDDTGAWVQRYESGSAMTHYNPTLTQGNEEFYLRDRTQKLSVFLQELRD